MFTFNGNYKWIDELLRLVSDYNAREHRTIGMRPVDPDDILLPFSCPSYRPLSTCIFFALSLMNSVIIALLFLSFIKLGTFLFASDTRC